MQRLHHPIRAIREPFGTAGLIIACIALVLALTGAAFAAAGFSGKQKKEVEKIAKKFSGKPGAAGAQGPAGAAGKNGSNGAPGANGKSVTVAEIAEGEEACEERGGAMVRQEGSVGTEVCNGERGREGSPWTAGGTLPSGKTETGTFAFVGVKENSFARTPISFPIELAAPVAEIGGECDQAGHPECLFHYVTREEAEHENGKTPPAACQGTVEEPKAAKGKLCVYEGGGFGLSTEEPAFPTTPGGLQGFGRAGATLEFFFKEEPSGSGEFVTGAMRGSWAVTAP
jgi:hypothetical protein